MFIWLAEPIAVAIIAIGPSFVAGFISYLGTEPVVRCEEMIYIHVLLQDMYTYASTSLETLPQKRMHSHLFVQWHGTPGKRDLRALRYGMLNVDDKNSFDFFRIRSVCEKTNVIEDCEGGKKGGEI